jgi:ankyrin repeat protein
MTDHCFNKNDSSPELQLIKEYKAVGKTILFPLHYNTDLMFIANQLRDPEHIRPVKRLSLCADRNLCYNPKTKAWKSRQLNLNRGQPKPGTQFTKKEAVSMLPSPPKIRFFHYDKPQAIGLLFDVSKLHLKGEKYIWKFNANSNSRWWIKNNTMLGEHALKPSVSLNELKEYLRNRVRKWGTLQHSEQLFGLCKEALVALFAHMDTLFTRLNTLRAQMVIQNVLGLDLPILIITPSGQPAVYSEAQQISDLQKAKTNLSMRRLIDSFGEDVDSIILNLQQKKLKRRAIKNTDELYNAIINRQSTKALMLLENEVNLNDVYSTVICNKNMLCIAIFYGLNAVIDKMLTMNLASSTLMTTLHFLIREKTDFHSLLIKKILQERKDLNLNDCNHDECKNTVLHLAIINNHSTDMIEYLCQAGASILRRNAENKSALDLALELGQYNSVIAFFKNRPSMEENNLSWGTFKYIFDCVGWNNKTLFTQLIEHQMQLQTCSEELRDIVKKHALACFNYLMTNQEKNKAVASRKTLLNNILFEKFPNRRLIEAEITHYIQGKGDYSESIINKFLWKEDSYSRVAHAYNLGLFKTSLDSEASLKFEDLSKKEKKSLVSSLLHIGKKVF